MVDAAGSFASAWFEFLTTECADEARVREEAEEAEEWERRLQQDQVLCFFEQEYLDNEDAYTPYLEGEKTAQLETMRLQYYNLDNAIDFNNDEIVRLLGELQHARKDLKTNIHTPVYERRGEHVQAQKKIRCTIAGLKLDIGDCKNKCNQKRREKESIYPSLSALISELQLNKMLRGGMKKVDAGIVEQHAGGPADIATTTTNGHLTQVRARPRGRRRKHVSNAAINDILRRKDDD